MPTQKKNNELISPISPEPVNQKPSVSQWLSKYGLMASIIFGAVVIAMAVSAAAVFVAGSYFYHAYQLRLSSQNQNSALPTEQIVDLQLQSDAPTLGDPNAKVTLVEYGDFQCPFCGKFYKTALPQLKSQYIDTGKAKFIFQDFAFLGEESFYAAEAARCAGDQGKYWDFYNLLYDNQKAENSGAFSQANLKKLARTVTGLDYAKFNKCVDSRSQKTAVEEETAAGEAYGVTATPTVFINGRKTEGSLPFTEYAKLIEAALK